MIPGATATTTEEHAINPIEIPIAVNAYFFKSLNSFAPFANPTFTPAALPIASGTINVTEVIVQIMFCAAAYIPDTLPIITVMPLNATNSTMIASDAGKPTRSISL